MTIAISVIQYDGDDDDDDDEDAKETFEESLFVC